MANERENLIDFLYLTVTLIYALTALSSKDIACTYAVPTCMAVTTPSSDILTILELVLEYITSLFLAFLGKTSTSNFSVFPIVKSKDFCAIITFSGTVFLFTFTVI